MIEFAPYFSWFLTLLLMSLLLGLLALVGIALIRSNLSNNRKSIKLLLNSWLILILLAFLIQPFWKAKSLSEPLLIHADNIVPERLAYLKDSLKAEKSIEISKYEEGGNPLYLIGQDYSWEQLDLLAGKEVQWIPLFSEGQLTHIHWEGIRRQGDLQIISGNMIVKDSARISVNEYGETIAETTLYGGKQDFELTFPVRIAGRNQMEFMINDEVIDSINFFVVPNIPLSYQLEFGSPNAEARLLAEFLIKKGHQVHLNIQLSKNMEFRANPASYDRPDVLITDPSQVHRKDFQDALANGSSLILLNLSDPAVDVSRINSLLGTNFNLERNANLDRREIEPNLHSWPYELVSNLSQREAIAGAMAFQHVGSAKVGISLLEPTFPLMLRGDSTAYNRIWNQVLGALAPHDKSIIQIDQPVFDQIPNLVNSSQQEASNQFLTIADDTLFLHPSRVNQFRASTNWIPRGQGWQSFNDSLQVYSYGTGWGEINSLKRITQFILSSRQQTFHQDDETVSRINGWIWLGLFLISFGLVWLEPRI